MSENVVVQQRKLCIGEHSKDARSTERGQHDLQLSRLALLLHPLHLAARPVPLHRLCRPLLASLPLSPPTSGVTTVAGAKAYSLSLRFKVRHHRIEGARRSLQRLRGTRYPGVEMEMEEIQQCCKDEKVQGNNSVLDEIQSRTFVIPMSIFVLIFSLLACTGNDTMVFLGPSIFSEVTISSSWHNLVLGQGVFSLGNSLSLL